MLYASSESQTLTYYPTEDMIHVIRSAHLQSRRMQILQTPSGTDRFCCICNFFAFSILLGCFTLQLGSVTVVWNDKCDTKVFQLDITLADDTAGYKNAITTVPCSGKTADVPSCIWMAAVKSEARDEYDDVPNRYANL
jgi:hypothetical protein